MKNIYLFIPSIAMSLIFLDVAKMILLQILPQVVKVYTLKALFPIPKFLVKLLFKKNEDGSTYDLLEINGSSTDIHPALFILTT